MANTSEPHAGIELDRIEISLQDDRFQSFGPSGFNGDTLDYKLFIETLNNGMMKSVPFLSFTNQINSVNQILQMKYSSASDIADVILKDMALSTKLLKLVNSSFYGQFSNKRVSTISEAMIILGTEEIKLAATSLKIYELLKNISNVKLLKDMAIRSLQRSIIARELSLADKIKDAETIQIIAMLFGFGEYLVAFFTPKLYFHIEMVIDQKHISKEQASKSVIGISYSQLGRFFSAKWNLPETIVSAMKPVSNTDLLKQDQVEENKKQIICSFSDDLCNIDFSQFGDTVGKKIFLICEKYKAVLGITPAKAVDLLKMSYQKINQHASILKAS